MKITDTIAAVSTPRGKGGVAMIRISGECALEVFDRVFKCRKGAVSDGLEPSRLYRGDIVGLDGEVLDDGMAAIFRSPASYTGEDVAEIYCHGGILITERVLSSVLLAGARAAEAGEFTRRAFVSGKLTLSEAEALGGLLEAGSFSQLRLARNGMSGRLSGSIRAVYESLRDVMTGIYAAIDFPDEDLNEYSRAQIYDMLLSARGEIEKLCATYKTGRAVAEGIPTVICGRANAGKSSLYNAIVGYEAAIVTDIEGTTRDVLKQSTTLGTTTLLLSDTAGLRETADVVEGMGIERAYREIESSELVIAVFDGASALCEDDLAFISRIKDSGKACIAVINKSDLHANEDTERLIKESFEHTVRLSASSGEGLEVLAAEVDSMFIDGDIDIDNDAIVAGARQFSSLESARMHLSDSLSEIEADTPLDLCCIGIESALAALGEVDGRQIGEEIVSGIFSKFCVGK